MEVSLAELALVVSGELEGPAERRVNGLKGIEEAGPADVAFVANPKYAKFLDTTQAGVVLVGQAQKTPPGLAIIRVADPYLAYAQLLTKATARPREVLGVHPRAVVEDTAVLGQEVNVHALAYVGHGARLGNRVDIHPGAYVGPGVEIGDDTVIHPGVVICHDCRVGRRVIIHSGTVIGADGYGFVPQGERHFKIPQVGITQIDDDVEIGANCTVDRAATGRTWIKEGAKLDDLVHVAHNCVIGEHSLLVAQVGVSGSSKLGRGVVLGGQAGIVGHLNLGDGVMVGAQCGVTADVEPGAVVQGSPHMPHRLWLRVMVLLRKLPELFDRVKALEKKSAARD